MNFPINNVSDSFLEFTEEDFEQEVAPTEWDNVRDEATFKVLSIGFNSALTKIIAAASKLQRTMSTALELGEDEAAEEPTMEELLLEMQETVDREMEEFDRASDLIQSASDFYITYTPEDIDGNS